MHETDWATRIRTSYDTVAESYAELLADHDEPVSLSMIGLFAELVRRGAAGTRVLDAGCGPGRLTGVLRDLGLDPCGVDLSPAMVGIARRSHPDLEFAVGSMTELPYPDGAFAGVMAFHSLIHLPDAEADVAIGELVRCVAPGGVLLVTFHVGDEVTRKTEGYGGHPMDVDIHRRSLAAMAALLERHGLHVEVRTEHRLDPLASTPQGLLLARR